MSLFSSVSIGSGNGLKPGWSFLPRYQGSEWRLICYARRRIDRIVESLPEKCAGAKNDEVVAEFRKAHKWLNDEDWHIFLDGTGKQWDAWLSEQLTRNPG